MSNSWRDTLRMRSEGLKAGFIASDRPLEEQPPWADADDDGAAAEYLADAELDDDDENTRQSADADHPSRDRYHRWPF